MYCTPQIYANFFCSVAVYIVWNGSGVHHRSLADADFSLWESHSSHSSSKPPSNDGGGVDFSPGPLRIMSCLPWHVISFCFEEIAHLNFTRRATYCSLAEALKWQGLIVIHTAVHTQDFFLNTTAHLRKGVAH